MEGEREGMVAIVQGLEDAGLMVYLTRVGRRKSQHERKRHPNIIGIKHINEMPRAIGTDTDDWHGHRIGTANEPRGRYGHRVGTAAEPGGWHGHRISAATELGGWHDHRIGTAAEPGGRYGHRVSTESGTGGWHGHRVSTAAEPGGWHGHRVSTAAGTGGWHVPTMGRATSTDCRHGGRYSPGMDPPTHDSSPRRGSQLTNAGPILQDETYSSTYRLLHCNRSGSSPPLEISEFPPQKTSPSLTHGNFRMGNTDVAADAVKDVYRHRNAIFSAKNNQMAKQHVSSYARARGMDSFAHSLRQYPSIPDRTTSDDLIQRLVSHTQAKHLKSPYHSKSMRSLLRKTAHDSKVQPAARKISKNIQTYTRRKNQSPIETRPKANYDIRVNIVKNKPHDSACSNRNDISHRDNQPNSTCDPLRSCSDRQRDADVRHLDVSRFVRDAVRQIFTDKSHACPKMLERYSRHKMECYRKQKLSSSLSIESEAQTLPSSRDSPTTSRYAPKQGPKTNICGYCHNPLPCGCRRSVQKLRFEKSMRDNPSHSLNLICPDEACPDDEPCPCPEPTLEDKIGNKIEEYVAGWMKEIPVNDNFTANDRKKREATVKNLAHYFKEIIRDDDFEDKARKEILRSLNRLPMWCPGDKAEQEAFKEQFIDKLLVKLMELRSVVDNFKDTIAKWVNELPFKPADAKGRPISKEAITNNIVSLLKPLTNGLVEVDEYKEVLVPEILKVIEKLPIVTVSSEDKEILANKLVDSLADVPVVMASDEIEMRILEWIEGIPEFSDSSPSYKRQAIEHLAKICKEQPNDENKEIKMKNEIYDMLESKQCADLEKQFQKDVTDWIDNIPQLFPRNPIEKKENFELSQKLAHRFSSLKSKDLDERKFQDQLLDEIKYNLQSAVDKRNEQMDSKTENKLANDLWKSLAATAKGKEETETDFQTDDDVPGVDNAELSDSESEIQSSKNLRNTRNRAKILTSQLLNKLSKANDEPLKSHVKKSQDQARQDTKDISKDLLKYELEKKGGINRTTSIEKLGSQPMSGIKSSQDKVIDLTKTVQTWLDNVPELAGDKEANKKRVEELVKKLQTSQVTGGQEMAEIMTDFLKDEIEKEGGVVDIRAIDKMKSQLASDLKGQELANTVETWLDKVPEFSGDKEENKKRIEKLVKKIQDSQVTGGQEMAEIMTDFLKDEIEKEGGVVDNRAIDKMKSQLASDLKGQELANTVETWLDKVPEFSGDKEENKKRVEKLVKKIQDSQVTGGQEMAEIMKDFLKDEIEKEGGVVDNRAIDKMASQLTTDIKGQDLANKVKTLLDKVPEFTGDKEENKKRVENLIKKIQGSQVTDGQEMAEIMKDFLKDEIKNKGGKVDSKMIEKLGTELMADIMSDDKNKELAQTVQTLPNKFAELSGNKKSNVNRDKFVNKIKDSRAYGEQEKPDNINNFLKKEIKKEGGNVDSRSDKKFGNRLTSEIKSNDIGQTIGPWTTENVPKLASDKEANKKRINKIDKKIQESPDIGGQEMPGISKHFPKDEIKKKGGRVDSRFNENLGNGLMNKTKTEEINKNMAQNVQTFFDNIPELSSDKEENKKRVEKLLKKIQDSQTVDGKNMQDIVQNFLKDEIEREGGIVDSRTIEKLGKKLVSDIKSEATGKAMAQTVHTWVDKVPILSGDKEANEESFKKLVTKVQNSQVNGGLDKPEIMKNFMKDKTKNKGVIVDPKTIGKFENQRPMMKPNISLIGEDDLREWISVEVGDVLDESGITENRDDIETDLIDSLIDQVMRGDIAHHHLKDSVNSILKNANFPIKQIGNISDNIVERLGQLDLSKKLLPSHKFKTSTPNKIQNKSVISKKDRVEPLMSVSGGYNTERDSAGPGGYNTKRDSEGSDKSQAESNDSKRDSGGSDRQQSGGYDSKRDSTGSGHTQSGGYGSRRGSAGSGKSKEGFDSRRNSTKIRYSTRLENIIKNWIDELPIDQDIIKDEEVKDTITRDLANDIVDRQKYLQLNPEIQISDEDEFENLKYQVYRWLNKLLDISDLSPFLPNIEDLMNRIKELDVTQLGKQAISLEELQEAIFSWIKQKPSNSYKSDDINFPRDMAITLAEKIIPYLSKLDTDSKIDSEILRWLPEVFNDPSPQKLSEMTKELNSILQRMGGTSVKKDQKGFKSPADLLYETVDKWCNDLPIYDGHSPEAQERVNTLKQNLASKLINKIGELNMNPEIFKDEILYEDLLLDEIDKLLASVPKNPELDKYLPALKCDFISKVKEAKQKIGNELAGQAYKQQLRDIISTSLRLPECLSPDDQASFEILKDNLADAFINLHYVTDNEVDRNKFRTKIGEEIVVFCNEYLRRHPETPVDSNKLTQQLYQALHQVSSPKDESMRSEVEQSRIKDLINDWIKRLPLREQSGPEQLHRNKIVSVLAKNLRELEKEKEFDPNIDIDGKMFDEIIRVLKKLPFKPSNESKMPKMANQLRDMLLKTEESRTFVVPSRHPVVCPMSSRLCSCQFTPSLPSCTLSTEDREHLQRIRERSNFVRRSFVRDTSSQINIRPAYWGARTSCTQPNISYGMSQTSPFQFPQDCSSIQRTSSPCYSPNVIVKEYFWGSPNTENLQESNSQPGPCLPTQGTQPRQANMTCASPQGISQQASPRENPYSPSGPFSPQYMPQRPSQIPQQPSTSSAVPCPCRDQQQSYQNNPGALPKYETRTGVPQPCRSPEPRKKQYPKTGPSTFWKGPRVTHLGSFDDVKCPRDSAPKPKNQRSGVVEDDDDDWSTLRFPEDAGFWDSSSRECCINRSSPQPFVRERERKEEKFRCRCKEKVLITCKGRQSRSYREVCPFCHDDPTQRCSKCSGVNCPHPSYLYFK